MVNAAFVALLLVRVVVGVTMIAHGINHWKGGGPRGGAGWVELTIASRFNG